MSPVQKSGKSDKSTRESPPTTLKITKQHILGKSELSPVKMSGKSDTSTHQPKKKFTRKKRKGLTKKVIDQVNLILKKFNLIQLPTIFRQKIKFLTLFKYQEKISVNQTFVVPTPNFY